MLFFIVTVETSSSWIYYIHTGVSGGTFNLSPAGCRKCLWFIVQEKVRLLQITEWPAGLEIKDQGGGRGKFEVKSVTYCNACTCTPLHNIISICLAVKRAWSPRLYCSGIVLCGGLWCLLLAGAWPWVGQTWAH